jgi:hypothetical protein
LAGQVAKREFAGPGDPLKIRFHDVAQLAFCDSQKAENNFAVPFDPFKHSFLVLAQFVCWAVHEAEYEFPGTGEPSVEKGLLGPRWTPLVTLIFGFDSMTQSTLTWMTQTTFTRTTQTTLTINECQ